MKKTFFYLFSTLLISIFLTGCAGKSSSQDSSSEKYIEEFKFRNFSNEQEVDLDGIDCLFNFNIDWPEEGDPIVLEKIREWIAGAVINREVAYNNVNGFVEAIINEEVPGNIAKTVNVKIIVVKSEINVETSVEWSAGFSLASPWGKTVHTGVFSRADGELLSQNIVREGEDEILNK